MNGQPAARTDQERETRWTARLDDLPAAAPGIAAWLREPGLLTERLRSCCDGTVGLAVVSEGDAQLLAGEAELLRAPTGPAFVREIELTCDSRPWVFAQTLVPQTTLARHGWLASLGRTALGERLAAMPGLERGPLEYARLIPSNRLYRRALRERRDSPATLWARRSWFAIAGDRLLVQEVFLPEAHA